MSELSELGQVLHEEHFRILVAICGLENRISGAAGERPLDPGEDEDRRLLLGLIASLDHVIVHHCFEETVIFPLIRGRGEGDLARLLTREHGAIEPKARCLRMLAAEIVDRPPTADAWASFRSAGAELVGEVMRHLEKEELTIVQRLPLFLDSQTDHELAVRHATENYAGAARPSAGGNGGSGVERRAAAAIARNGHVSHATAAARAAARRRSTSLPSRP